ncbi:hypothetical protein K435DRAFT_855260 [Dendrothele bispora CBS 962.96]|uniref:Uncharacterized protein n=1 Tax=Dendrothele bispora (strain CBS 962.96) TaxID=1314807 RepID=A0A4S8MBM0_DENBC|nr:hypothetical protein K435DRAFT_855260 [Dendrothele bispora CBS 962.96]
MSTLGQPVQHVTRSADGPLATLATTSEAPLSAKSIGRPQILSLSGIRSKELEQFGVELSFTSIRAALSDGLNNSSSGPRFAYMQTSVQAWSDKSPLTWNAVTLPRNGFALLEDTKRPTEPHYCCYRSQIWQWRAGSLTSAKAEPFTYPNLEITVSSSTRWIVKLYNKLEETLKISLTLDITLPLHHQAFR